MTQGQTSPIYEISSDSDPFILREDPSKIAEARVYDLAERTTRFGETVIDFARKIPVDPVTQPLISQVVRAGTSVGANYCEADDAATKKEFRYKIGTCRKEARETKYWIRVIAKAVPELCPNARLLWQEADRKSVV